MKQIDVIKRDGKRQTEAFDSKKLHHSIVAACLSVKTPDGQSEEIADTVCDLVNEWLEKHQEVTSRDIRNITARYLDKQHPEAAYLYKNHHNII